MVRSEMCCREAGSNETVDFWFALRSKYSRLPLTVKMREERRKSILTRDVDITWTTLKNSCRGQDIPSHFSTEPKDFSWTSVRMKRASSLVVV